MILSALAPPRIGLLGQKNKMCFHNWKLWVFLLMPSWLYSSIPLIFSLGVSFLSRHSNFVWLKYTNIRQNMFFCTLSKYLETVISSVFPVIQLLKQVFYMHQNKIRMSVCLSWNYTKTILHIVIPMYTFAWY